MDKITITRGVSVFIIRMILGRNNLNGYIAKKNAITKMGKRIIYYGITKKWVRVIFFIKITIELFSNAGEYYLNT